MVKRIKCVELFTIFQVVNVSLWLIELFTKFIDIQWICCVHMVIVGLMGGSAYVGCFYFLMNNDKIAPNLKELCINIGTVFNDSGILTASLLVLGFDNIYDYYK